MATAIAEIVEAEIELSPEEILGNLAQCVSPSMSAKAQAVLSLLSANMTPTMACRTSRLDYQRWKALCAKQPEYAALCEEARARGAEFRAMNKIADSDDWRAQAKLLSIMRPEEFADNDGKGSSGPNITVQIAIGNPTQLQPGETITITQERG